MFSCYNIRDVRYLLHSLHSQLWHCVHRQEKINKKDCLESNQTKNFKSLRDKKGVDSQGQWIVGFLETGRTQRREREKQTWNPPWYMVDGHLTSGRKVKIVLFLVIKYMSLPLVNKPNCFVVHTSVHLCLLLFTCVFFFA